MFCFYYRKSLTRYRFSVTSNGKLLYPSVTPPLNYSSLTLPGVKVFTGLPLMYRYNECYKLVLQSQHRPLNVSALHLMIQRVWKQDKQGNIINNTEIFVILIDYLHISDFNYKIICFYMVF